MSPECSLREVGSTHHEKKKVKNFCSARPGGDGGCTQVCGMTFYVPPSGQMGLLFVSDQSRDETQCKEAPNQVYQSFSAASLGFRNNSPAVGTGFNPRLYSFSPCHSDLASASSTFVSGTYDGQNRFFIALA